MRREDDEGGREDPVPEPERSGPSTRWIIVIVAAVLLVIFALQIAARVDVDFFVFDTEARVVTVIVVAAILGFLIGYFVGRPSTVERKAMRMGMD